MMQKVCQFKANFLERKMFRNKSNFILNCQTISAVKVHDYSGTQMEICDKIFTSFSVEYGWKWGEFHSVERFPLLWLKKSFVWFVENSEKANTQELIWGTSNSVPVRLIWETLSSKTFDPENSDEQMLLPVYMCWSNDISFVYVLVKLHFLRLCVGQMTFLAFLCWSNDISCVYVLVK